MSMITSARAAIIGEPERCPELAEGVVEDGRPVQHQPAWLALKDAATALQDLQAQDGSAR